MKQISWINGYPYHFEVEGSGTPTWVFLHGFLGSRADFAAIKPHGTRIYLDLLGLGPNKPTVKPATRFTAEQQIAELHMLFMQLDLKDIHLVGYSMGARLALAYALTYPNDLTALILEGGTAGLADQTQRQARQLADTEKAQRIEQTGMQTFVSEWEKLPLFLSQQSLSDEQKSFMHQQRVQQNPNNVQASLHFFGTGSMPNLWPKLQNLQVPVLLINGSLDQKFLAISEQMLTNLPLGQQVIVPNVGHNVHFEAPVAYTQALMQI